MTTEIQHNQNTIEWFRARLGNITGSAVGAIMTKPRSKDQQWSATAESYLQQVAYERAMNPLVVNDDHMFGRYLDLTQVKSKVLDWGHTQEGYAADLFAKTFRDYYEPFSEPFTLDLVEPPSVKCKDIPHFASSPDRMFTNPVSGEECCVEIKSPLGKAFTKYAMCILLEDQDARLEALKKAESDYYWQIFSHMLATGTHTCYWVIYNPFAQVPLFSMCINDVEDILNEMRERIALANEYVDQLVAKLLQGQ